MVSQTWTATDMEYSIMSKTLASLILSIGIAVACVVVFSQNVLIGLFVLLTILLEVCPLFGFLFGVMRYEFGAIEAIGVVTFVGMSVDYCLHLAHGYHVAEKMSRSEKLQLTLVNLGPSILGGALTTAAATAFLLPCRILLFVKLGTMLVANTILSLLYTFVFLGPLLMILGPLEDAGSFLWLFRHVCGCWACRNAKRYRRSEAAIEGSPTGWWKPRRCSLMNGTNEAPRSASTDPAPIFLGNSEWTTLAKVGVKQKPFCKTLSGSGQLH